MANFIEELYYGNVNPQQRSTDRNTTQQEQMVILSDEEQTHYQYAHDVHKTIEEIDGMGQRTITGKVAVSKDDFQTLTALAKEGITGRKEIGRLSDEADYYRSKYSKTKSALESLQQKYDLLKEKCKPFLEALEHFPELVKTFMDKLKDLFTAKEAQELVRQLKSLSMTGEIIGEVIPKQEKDLIIE